MSSLLQSPGRVDRKKGVEIFLYKAKRVDLAGFKDCGSEDVEPVPYTRPNGTKTTVPKLYRIWRKPCGMLGCWVQFRITGMIHAPDLSVPMPVYTNEKWPKDAEALTDEESRAYWSK